MGNRDSYSDISSLPIIADYFGVSADCLLGHDTGKLLEISTDTEMRTRVSRDLMYRYYTKESYEKASYYANSLPSLDAGRKYTLGRSSLPEDRELSDYLQSNI